MSLDVVYLYCSNLTATEKLEIDKEVRKNRFELKFAIFFPFLPFPMVPQVSFFPFAGFIPQQIVRNERDQAESAVQPGASLQMERPSSMSHQEYTSLTKEQRRNLPDSRDGFICEEGHPHLVARYGQVVFKTPDHGKVHGLPVDEKNRTPQNEENALALWDSIVNMPKRKNIVFFDNGCIKEAPTVVMILLIFLIKILIPLLFLEKTKMGNITDLLLPVH